MHKIKLQAHKGVSSECPENTFVSFERAVMQKYDVIELDLEYTKDKKIVVLHDKTINRTACTADGSALSEEIRINDITYENACAFDFGAAVSPKFRGVKIPLFADVLDLAKRTGIRLKIDSKIQKFPADILNIFFSMIRKYREFVSVTSDNLEFIIKVLQAVPDISIDYDGMVDAGVLAALSRLIPRERLTVWLPYECSGTSWVNIPYASEDLSHLTKKYARLGIWILSDYESFYDAKKRFNPDIIETDGTIKPAINENCRYDMHTHSKNSHDSVCEVRDMKRAALQNGLSGFAVTDHCDIEYFASQNLDAIVQNSISDAKLADSEGGLSVLHGVEIGETFWHKDVSDNIIKNYGFDVVIGSVHAVRFPDFEMPYSTINFADMGAETAQKYLGRYFDDLLYMLENCDIDIAAHITCPLRYINGKYGLNINCRLYEDKIRHVLKTIIERKIALEVNTSCMCQGSGYNEPLPEEWIIQMYHDMGGYLITVGSDAHVAQNSANSFNSVYEMLKKIGFKNTYYYKNRHALQCAII